MKILQIIPSLPPVSCGVGDYAHELAREWKRHGVETYFLGGDPTWHGADAEFPCEAVAARSSAALQASLTQIYARDAFDAVVLQFSGYGYAPRGAPVWLMRGLQSWLRKKSAVPLMTMFHELYASGPVTSSAFWLSALQKYVCANVARISRIVRTNRAASAAWLGKVAPQHEGRILVLPVFSNMGEKCEAPPPSQRPSSLAIFGYQSDAANFWSPFPKMLKMLGVEKITGLGKTLAHNDHAVVVVDERGFLGTQEMSATLQKTRLGYLHYNPEYMGKSGILAAFAAHGVVPVLAPYAAELSESLVHGINVLRSELILEPLDPDVLDAMSHNILSWYAPHCIRATAAGYLKQLHGAA